jgi:ABC-type Na+ efflux pump permease subunit
VAATEIRIGGRRFAFWFMAAIYVVVAIFYHTRFMTVSPSDDSLTQSVKLARNSPYSLAIMLGLASFFFMHFTAALCVDPILRDRRIGLLPLVLAAPIRRPTYVFGKFLGAAFLTMLPPLFFALTAFIAQWVPNSQVGLMAPNVTGLLVGYLEFYVPFTLLIAGFVFALAIWSGNPKLVYSTVTVLFIAYFTLINLAEGVDHRWVAYCDPSGILYLGDVVGKGKTNAELNQIGWLTHPWFLVNRAALIVVGLGLPALAALSFSRREARVTAAKPKRRRAAAPAPAPAGGLLPAKAPLRPLSPQVPLRLGGLRQLMRVTGAELRLLTHERSLFFIVPLLALTLWTSISNVAGPFEAEVIPVSTQVALGMQWMLLIFLLGTTVFFSGETAYRDRECDLADLLHAYPVPESALVGGKVVANLILAVILIVIAVLTGLVYQATHQGGPVRLTPFVALFGGVLLPTVVFLIALGLAAGYLARSKPGGYALVLGIAGLLFVLFFRGHRHWLYNLPAFGLFNYSDLVGFGPLRSTLILQRLYLLGLAALLIGIAIAVYPRAAGGRGRGPSLAAIRERGALPMTTLGLLTALILGGVIFARVERGVGSLATERGRVRYEREVKPWLERRPEPEVAAVDLDLDLDPAHHAFRLQSTFALRNIGPAPIDTVHVTVNPRLLASGEMTLAGAPPARYENWVATFPLASRLAPGDSVVLACRFAGRVPDGVPRAGGELRSFIEPGGTYLHSFDPEPWLPTLGYNSDLEIQSDRTRRKFGLPKRETLPDADSTGITPGLFHQSLAFPYRARIRVPADERVLSAGRLVAEREAGPGRREFEYVSDGPIYFFPVMAGTWQEARDGTSAVYHDPLHDQNTTKILDALTSSRSTFSDLFAPFPYAELRLAEFPRLANFAMGYPTLIPYSESIGFLTRDSKKRANMNFYVTAHEVAHQWWGTVIWPGHGKGAAVLTESMANYSTLLMAGRHEGEAKRRQMFEDFEDRYLRRRDPNEERPLVQLDGDRRRDDVVWYNRGGVVFYMLHRMLGEEAMLTAIREFIARFSFQLDHATLDDLMAVFERRHPETRAFFDQYVRDKAIPNPGYRSATRRANGDGTWVVRCEIANSGQGDLDLEVAATRGERDQEGFEEARGRVALRGASPAAVEIRCPFEPASVEMDPDRVVLLQERTQGRRKL